VSVNPGNNHEQKQVHSQFKCIIHSHLTNKRWDLIQNNQ